MSQGAPLRRTSGPSRNSGATAASLTASASRFPLLATVSLSRVCFGTRSSPGTGKTKKTLGDGNIIKLNVNDANFEASIEGE